MSQHSQSGIERRHDPYLERRQMTQKITARHYLVVCVLSMLLVSCNCPTSGQDAPSDSVESLALPIDIAKVSSSFPRGKENPQSLLSLEQVTSGVQVLPDGYAVRYSGAITLLDGKVIQGEDITGKVLVGPWPFAEKDSRFRVKRFYRKAANVNSEKATSLAAFFKPTTTNSEGWKVGDQGRFAMRMTLSLSIDAKSGTPGKGTVEVFRKSSHLTWMSSRGRAILGLDAEIEAGLGSWMRWGRRIDGLSRWWSGSSGRSFNRRWMT